MGRAKGSAGEVRAQLYLALDRGYITQHDFANAKTLAETCSKQITRFIQYLAAQPATRKTREEPAPYDL